MKRIFNTLLIIMLAFIIAAPSQVLAEKKNKRYPYGCIPQGYKFSYYTLLLKPVVKRHPQAIYFIHNISHQSVSLLQQRSGDDHYIMHINNTIRPNNWAVFTTDEKLIKFICTNKAKKGLHDKVINCGKALDICMYPSPKFGDNNRGNYWAVTNGSMYGSVRSMVYQGIILLGS